MKRIRVPNAMNENAQFLDAIQSSPQDESLRLVYADWLEERGDERAELVRLETAMSKMRVFSDSYFNNKARRDELRGKADGSWLQAIGYVPTHRPMFQEMPATLVERWRLIDEFIDLWSPIIPGPNGYSEDQIVNAETHIGRPLPNALRNWYARYGNRRDIWSIQDSMVDPNYLELDAINKCLVIRVENQNCERWGILESDLALDDPPIYEFEQPGQASTTTSAFLLQVLLYESMFGAKFSAGGETPNAVIEESIERKYSKCDLPDRYWVATPIHFYEGCDIVLQTHAESWVYVAARTEAALTQLDAALLKWLERYR